ncbi:VOC family protein [Nocardioides baculatus]|jgi:catechol 2,3-dioxygenase-like lactoylglutathione lyase family enzyme|uniref:VOC family protein n=1 Tax=Nocardioides baculatus TaxID=2801337 RepID=A0ABS1LAV2_9ACTN|nr:VOC family protein [Nocardioides baculatus]MBL0748543.1 VOC family protein [Nocardioides baculatus]
MTDQMTARIAMVTLDVAEVEPSADFWSALLGWEVAASTDDYAMLTGPDGSPALGLGRTDDFEAPSWPDTGRKQFHLDLAVDDIEAMAGRAVELGARLVDPQPGETWKVLLDPAGHPFCLTDAKNWG